jgi:hypothetical protein
MERRIRISGVGPAFLVERIAGLVLVPTFEAHGSLAPVACLDVIAAEVAGALGTLFQRLMRTAFNRALHDGNATSAFERYLSKSAAKQMHVWKKWKEHEVLYR